jgi:SAM-dependent methyltransferase
VRTTAEIEGPDWSARAPAWAELWAGLAQPAREAVAEATAIGAGTRFLDIGCGSGEMCLLAATRGAAVSGIDAADGMIEIARRRLPEADLRVGPMEQLPWEDGSFDVVTAFNALQFAADYAGALAEAARVVRRGGRVAICNWGRREDQEVLAVITPLRAMEPPAPEPPTPDPPLVREPGVLERLVRDAGLQATLAAEVDVPFELRDEATLQRAFLADAGPAVVEHAGEKAVRRTIVDTAAPFRRPDGSYRFANRFRYVIARGARAAVDSPP